MEQFKHFKGVYAVEKHAQSKPSSSAIRTKLIKKKGSTGHTEIKSSDGSKNKIKKWNRDGSAKRLELFTLSLSGDVSEYGEKIVKQRKLFFRFWDPNRSKLSAALFKGISQIGISPGKRVLYLGAASGTTVSHVSDIVGSSGKVFAIEFSEHVAKNLFFMARRRKNILPMLFDARFPEIYAPFIGECDVVYQDIAQKDQLDIFVKNSKLLLSPGGTALVCVKSRSIDVSKKPKDIFKQFKFQLEKEMKIVDYRELSPYEEDHAIFVAKF